MRVGVKLDLQDVPNFPEEGGAPAFKYHDPPKSAKVRAPVRSSAQYSYEGAAPRMCLVGTENPVRSRPNDAHHSYHAASTRARTGSGTHCAPFLAEPPVRVLVPLGGGRR